MDRSAHTEYSRAIVMNSIRLEVRGTVFSLIKPDNVAIANVPKKSVVAINKVDDRKLVEFTLAEELECTDQIVVGAQENSSSHSKTVRTILLANISTLGIGCGNPRARNPGF